MKKIQTLFASMIIVTLALAGAQAANAASYEVNPPEGGTWTHGTNKFSGTQWDAWSNYYHPAKSHKATAWWVGGNRSDSGRVRAGVTAQASVLGSTAGKAGYGVYSGI